MAATPASLPKTGWIRTMGIIAQWQQRPPCPKWTKPTSVARPTIPCLATPEQHDYQRVACRSRRGGALHHQPVFVRWEVLPLVQSTLGSAATPTTFMAASISARGGRAQKQESRRCRSPTGALPERHPPAAAREKGDDEGPRAAAAASHPSRSMGWRGGTRCVFSSPADG